MEILIIGDLVVAMVGRERDLKKVMEAVAMGLVARLEDLHLGMVMVLPLASSAMKMICGRRSV